MRMGAFGIGRWFGFPIRIDVSWFLVFALVVWTFMSLEFPRALPGRSDAVYLAMGTAAALLLFLSVLLHELAHSTVARARGIPVEGITLFIFGGVAEMRMEAQQPGDEFLLTVVGPLSSLALAGAFWGAGRGAVSIGWMPAASVAMTLAFLNTVLAVFNMIPAFPLDGGRIFRSIVWKITGSLATATRWATWLGRAFGWLLILNGAFLFWRGDALSGAWSAMLGWFLAGAAASASRQQRLREELEDVPVRRVMSAAPRAVPAEASIAEAAEGWFLGSERSLYPVVHEGRLVGVLAARDITAVDLEERHRTPVLEAMQPVDEIPIVAPGESLAVVVARLQAAGADRALVVREGELTGLVALRDVGRWLERRRELGLDGAERMAPAESTGDASELPGESGAAPRAAGGEPGEIGARPASEATRRLPGAGDPS